MSRDLFAEASTIRRTPRRSPWTILGSALAHAAILAALLVIPVLSALDNFVLHADESLTFVMPTTLPPSLPPPPAVRSPQPEITADVAPTMAPDRVTAPPVSAGSGPGVLGGAPDGKFTIGTGPVSNGVAPISLAPPPTAPPPVVPVRPGGNLKSPARTTYVPPVYPTLARTAHIEGSVIVEATIDEAGIVRNVRVLRSNALFDQAAIDAVTQWRYTPTKLNGVSVPVILSVTVMFTMK